MISEYGQYFILLLIVVFVIFFIMFISQPCIYHKERFDDTFDNMMDNKIKENMLMNMQDNEPIGVISNDLINRSEYINDDTVREFNRPRGI